ncbi:MAG TPA: glycerate kinase [Actinospica sp.]|jgi:glycerate kinase|nr:glycerate kinase [Actinospica sp.]
MRVICAPDKMRGCLEAGEAAAAIAAGVTAAGAVPVLHPLADGGEGSRAIVQAACGGRSLTTAAVDVFGGPVRAPFTLLEDSTALVEAAEVVGWVDSSGAGHDVMRASSAGLAAPLLAAVEHGAKRVIVFLGGTATMDGGLGLLAALGAGLRDADGVALSGRGADLARLRALDLEPARARLVGIELVAAVDVASPLHGPRGAAHLFGPQKGATPEQVAALDDGLRRLDTLFGTGSLPGAGAAGGIGAALLALGGRVQRGAELIRGLTRFDQALESADLCITAEGKVDAGSDAGKTVSAVVEACRGAGVPCVVLGGTLTPDAQRLYRRGAAAVLSIAPGPRDLESALRHAAEDLTNTAYAACRLATACGAIS